jgi:hypothetical protein
LKKLFFLDGFEPRGGGPKMPRPRCREIAHDKNMSMRGSRQRVQGAKPVRSKNRARQDCFGGYFGII